MLLVVISNIYISDVIFFIWLESNACNFCENSKLDNVIGILVSSLKGCECTHQYLYLGKSVWAEVTFCIIYKYPSSKNKYYSI